jgi:hypothetical protein
MFHHFRRIFFISIGAFSIVAASSGQLVSAQTYPVSDLLNSGGWELNSELSDEFNESILNRDRWLVIGEFENGVPVYKDPDSPNRKVWIGRAPSQFSGRNYRLENGKLILETRWEPNFPFSTIPDGTEVYKNITTACIIGRKMFTYGYMEIKCKAADAEVTSSFWATGNNTELDMFEFFGDHRQANKLDKDRELWWSIHDWSQSGGPSVYTEYHDLGYRVADAFHVYGFDWSEAGIKYYVDGKLLTQASAERIDAYALSKGFSKGYVITKAIKIWLDQETFPWHGVPDSMADLELNSPTDKKDDGIVDFEIDYVRIWQKSTTTSSQIDPNNMLSVRIFPNPVTDYLTISATNLSSVKILDSCGAVVKKIENVFDPVKISVAGLSAGMYLASVISGKEVITKKFQIIK